MTQRPSQDREPVSGPTRPDRRKNGRARPGARRRDDDAGELKFHGRHACRAIFTHRPGDIIRVYVTQERLKEFGDLLKWCAEQRRAYHIVEPDEIEKVTETVHHQGVAVLARKFRTLNDSQLIEMLRGGQANGPLLYLDGVQNPHNLGSILRTSAHFGVAAILGRTDELPAVTASAARVAEGGAESVRTARLRNPRETLARLKELGYRILATTSHSGGNVYNTEIPSQCVLVLGNEVTGVSQQLLSLADASLAIPGTGAVESLNVAVACAVLLSEAARRRTPGAGKSPEKRPSPAPSRRSRGKSRRVR
jgi:TrmH RNA methyltransferase